MEYKYTKKDFKAFKTSVNYWIDRFGITEWDIDFMQHKIDSAARTTYNNKSKLVCFQLANKICYDYCPQLNMHKLALHEVIHLLLADFGYVIQETKDYDSDLAIAQEHIVVMRLIRAFNE